MIPLPHYWDHVENFKNIIAYIILSVPAFILIVSGAIFAIVFFILIYPLYWALKNIKIEGSNGYY